MASSSETDIPHRRWLVVGTVLNRVLMPYLRMKIQQEMTPFYQTLVAKFGIDKQTYSSHQKTISTSAMKLNYESINHNSKGSRDPRCYDYRVQDDVSLAKLFMKSYMAHFNAFDGSFDASAALAVLCCAPPFTSAKLSAERVRSEIRNEWAHCDYASWTDVKYDTCFDLMKTLVEQLGFAPAEEEKLLGQLQLWRVHGLEFCVGKPLDDSFLHVILDEVQALSGSLPDWLEKTNSDIKQVLKCEFDKIQGMLCEVIRGGQEKTLTSQELGPRASGCFDENLKVRLTVMPSIWNKLLSSDYGGFAVNCKSVVFDAPDRNKWFTGRQIEIESLERCLALKYSDHYFRMAAICGLGGCGKTTLAAHFAWEHKPEYEGGVFWVSMEDEKKFDSCVNELALRLGLMADSLDCTLSKVLSFISRQEKRWLMVLDNVDQLQLSDNMQKVLSGRWKRESNGHIIITTRRERKEICQWMGLEPHCCVEVFSFPTQEAKKFLLTRAGGDNAAGQENELNELVIELGCHPLALEQAGAHIRSLQCPLSKYLEQYKLERLQLLSEHQANPSWEYESRSRLSVHTTWLLNFEYVKTSKYGEIATRFVHAAAFFDPDEIHEGLINAELLSLDVLDGKERELPLTNSLTVDALTKFSLFQRKSAGSIRLHRVVQEVIRGTMKSEEIPKAMRTSFQLIKNAASLDSESSTDKSVFSTIRHWLSLKRHIAYHLSHFGHKLDDSLTNELNRLVEEGAGEIVFAITQTLEKSNQTPENNRRLSALVDYGKYVFPSAPELKEKCVRISAPQLTSRSAESYFSSSSYMASRHHQAQHENGDLRKIKVCVNLRKVGHPTLRKLSTARKGL